MATGTELRQGSPAKRAAIVRAALEVFVREGYARASVDAIAATAGVSKRTIYDYYGDKEQLFLATVRETVEQQTAAFERLLDDTVGTAEDLEGALVAFGRAFATEVARSPQRSALLRLMIAEAAHFPQLLERGGATGGTQRALADRLADLAARGLLDVADPMEAAEFLGVLVTGRVHNHSWYGTVMLDDAEIERLATGGVEVFLKAYRPR
ncbi:TetR/AcrR family transcriptional regulator [Dactylosporangium sp. NPDC000244]|uniref:TetR/AcrR family transcriptional regulator n=1 Tax=Dactylosporangium sp. NPDC000244 TaxID=3154365 RepID=UPI00332AF0D7